MPASQTDTLISSYPSFSICIPNYNYARFIDKTIQSVLDQTYQNFEIVVVDNASTDDSVEVIKSFNDPRIKLFVNQYNVGFAPNLDRVVQKASNDFFITLSSDDLMRPTALEEYAKIIIELGDNAFLSLLTSAYEVIDEKGEIISYRDRQFHFDLPSLKRFDTHIEAFEGIQVFKDVFPRMSVPGPFCAQMYSRKLFEQVGGYASMNLIGPDAHFAYKVLLQNPTVIFINKPLFGYRVHNTNQFAQVRSSKSLNILIDRYIFTRAYSQNQLENAGVSTHQIIEHLIDYECLRGGLIELANGFWLNGFRNLMFALAAYPKQTTRCRKMYILIFLLLLGPLGKVFSRLVYTRFYKNKRHG